MFATYLSARPDYLVVGNVLLLHLAAVIAHLFGDGIADTPQIIAVLTYVFYGCVAAFPVIALREHLPLWARGLIALLVASVPLGGSAAEIWGRSSNIGFAFAYVVVLAIIWRETLLKQQRPRLVLLADLLIILCCATNPIAMPVAVGYLFYAFWSRGIRPALGTMLPLVIGLVLVGVTNVSGILQSERLIEEVSAPRTFSGLLLSGVARPLLYPLLFPVYHRLADGTALLAAGVLFLFFAAAFVFGQNRGTFAFWLGCTAFVTITISLQRPLLPEQLGGYGGSYPDRYFYAQNIMVLVAVIWGAVLLARQRGAGVLALAVPGALVLLFATNLSRIFLYSQVSCSPVGTDFARQIAAAQLVPGRDDVVAVEICPSGWLIELPRVRR